MYRYKPFLNINNVFNGFLQSSKYCSKPVIKTHLLMDLLDINYRLAYKIWCKYKFFDTLEPARIKETCVVLEQLGVTKENIVENPKIFTIHPLVITNHATVMAEGGIINIDAYRIINYLSLTRRSIRMLKIHAAIPEHVNVIESFQSHVDRPPENVEPIAKLSDEDSFFNTYMTVLAHFLKWRLEYPSDKAVDESLKKYVRIKHRSLKNINEIIDIYENELNFSKEKIRQNGYLLHVSKDNIRKILSELKIFLSKDIKDIVMAYPKILTVSYDNLVGILNVLKKYNLPDESCLKSLSIFTLTPQSVEERINELKNIPEFEVLKDHPRIVKLIHVTPQAKNRLNYLKSINVNNASLHILSTPNNFFRRSALNGFAAIGGADRLHILSKEFDKPVQEIKKYLSRHPFWMRVNLPTILETLKFLQLHFSKDDIFNNIQILLYPKNCIEERLQKLKTETDMTEKVTPSQMLSLCLYHMELPYNFSGDGVWPVNENSPDNII